MNDVVTAREIHALRDDFREVGRGINSRLDILNGQTRRHGENIARLDTSRQQHDERLALGDRKFDEIMTAIAGLRAMVEHATSKAVNQAVPLAVDAALPQATKDAMRGSAKWVPIGATGGAFLASFLWQLATHLWGK